MKHFHDWLKYYVELEQLEFEYEKEDEQYLINNALCIDDQIFAEGWFV